MTIVTNWISMRDQWSDLSTVDADGTKTWDVSRMDAGFDPSDIAVTRLSALSPVYQFEAPFAVDWCLLQPFEIFSLTETSSTTLRAAVTSAALSLSSQWLRVYRRQWLRYSWLYAKRQSNDAIACGSLSPLMDLATLGETTL